MRWLSVVGALCGPWTSVAMAEPVDCGGVEGEGIREMRALYEAERSFLGEKDKYSQDLAQVGFAPAACADGSRAPVPGPGWVAGCHFAYQVTSVTGLPVPTFTAIARGAAGTPAEDVTLGIGSPANQDIVFWLENAETRRFVDWYECRSTGSFSAQEMEGIEAMSHAFLAMQAFLQEKDRYPSLLAQSGFRPLSCTDGARAPVPGPDWVAGCRFAYHVESVTGFPNSSFLVIARGAAGTPVADVTVGIGSSPSQVITFWLERSGVRRPIAWDEREPAESVCAAQERVGVEEIRALFTAERAYLQEKDRYSSDLAQVGFSPLGCTDGTRPSGPDSWWVGGCRFIYHVEVTGPFSFIATARAVSGLVAGMTLRIDETGTLTRTPAPSGACP
ncbi:hypothetical protein BON30_32460 [Cystobacter ferrugineus]|uniref:Uncharacterized protein n=2 Tax=Cystobacter ferrugineus TaxID=83449 RepID=A0A1L9B2N0_9BACT|nr:hypothetical protein BON30_32460 [Cystobacter ferrugineus]